MVASRVAAFVRNAIVAAGTMCVAAAVLAASADPAEAARRKKGGGYAPPQASIVVDVKTGRMLQGSNPDALRHPASITKVMTLYMLFEQIERGRFTLESPLRVSSWAASRPPSKIGFDPGETIEVEDAIKALVTKSANDVASVVAEAIAGDEDRFAEMMTRKARALGMRNTVFRNASGLPDPEQVTTARDLTILGRALHDRFPKYWRYFQTRNFEYAGRNYRNHNRLLGRVDGVDGIKTGYTRASGFNLLTSARTGNRHVMAVVLGGRSGRSRDAQMASLVEQHLPKAFAGARTAPVIAEARVEEAPVRVAAAETRPAPRAEAEEAPAAPPAPAAAPAAPVQPAARAVPNTRTPVRVAEAAPPRPAASVPVTAFAAQPQRADESQSPPRMRWVTGAQPAARAQSQRVQAAAPRPPQPVPGRQTQVAHAPETTSSVSPRRPAQASRSGWVIQLGATDDEGKAKAILAKAKTANRSVLFDAEAFTEKVEKGGATLWRARFAGFEGGEAQQACNSLKRSGFACFAQRI
jgi:D-alanyl-D-alanine carboxypeptidase